MSKNNKHVTKNSKTKKSTKKLLPKKSKVRKIKKEIIDNNSNLKKKIIKTKKGITDNEDINEKISSLRQKLRENYEEQKKLMDDLNKLLTVQKETKLSNYSGNRISSVKITNFNNPERVPESLAKLLDIKEKMLPRSKITNLIYEYFTDNNMYDTKNKKEIIPNAEIKNIFGMGKNDIITFYNLQTWLKKVYDEET